MKKIRGPYYPFGNKLFVGIIKFYDKEKDFGFIASNNYGMDSNEYFKSDEQGFYIDSTCWESTLPEKKMVVFRPLKEGSRVQAKDVRPVNLEIDRTLIMDYYRHNNVITFSEKEQVFRQLSYRRKFEGYRTVTRTVYISTKCGMCRYQTINEFVEAFNTTHDFQTLCKEFDILVSSIGGETNYNDQIRGNYSNRSVEHKAIKDVFDLLDENQIEELIAKHPSIQFLAPDHIILKNIDCIDRKWGLSATVIESLKQEEERKKFEKVLKNIENGLVGLTRQEIENLKSQYDGKLSENHNLILVNRIDEYILSNCHSLLSDIDKDKDFKLVVNIISTLESEYKQLSENGRTLFEKESYFQVIKNAMERMKSFHWHYPLKQQLIRLLESSMIIGKNTEQDLYQTVYQIFVNDYESAFTGDNNLSVSDFKFDCDYFIKSRLEQNDYDKLIEQTEKTVVGKGSFRNIINWFEFREKKIPIEARSKFLNLDNEDICSNIEYLKMFDDETCILLSDLVDRFASTEEFAFFVPANIEGYIPGPSNKNLNVAKEIISIYGTEKSTIVFARLKYEDRLVLYKEYSLEVITPTELKEYLKDKPLDDYSNVFDTESGKDAALFLIKDCDCSTKNGISDAVYWMLKYVGEEPYEYYELREWNSKKQELVRLLSATNNEYLKIVVWAVFFMSSGQIKLLKEIFYLFPVGLQIQVVKKLFGLMAERKVKPSLDWIETILGVKDHDICLPVLIVFKYLRMKIEDPKSNMTDSMMLPLFIKRKDYHDWYLVNNFLNVCNGRFDKEYDDDKNTIDDSYRHYNGIVEKKSIDNKFVCRLTLTRKQIDKWDNDTVYNNKEYSNIQEYIAIAFPTETYKTSILNGNVTYDFEESLEQDVRIMAQRYRIKLYDVNYNMHYSYDSDYTKFCCECRVSSKLDNETNKVFLWCSNRPCFCSPSIFHTLSEWKRYTILDFMRILSIPTDYINQKGKRTRHGQYIIFSTYLQSFHEFLNHLKCRGCGQLMEPCDISNFARTTITEFHCVHDDCKNKGEVIYLNRCFNSKCNEIIDSRDSRQCPNGSYICQECGSCCSHNKYIERHARLVKTGGYISQRLLDLIRLNEGHWEKQERYCYKCGQKIENYECPSCNVKYDSNLIVS